MDHTVALVTPDRISPYEFSIACEVFGLARGEIMRAHGLSSWYDLRICTARPDVPVRSTFGFRLAIDDGLDVVAAADTVIVPMAPKPPDAESMPTHQREPAAVHPDVLDAVRAAHDRGARIVSFCSGALVLAAAGILDGRRATTHWMYLQTLRDWYPRVEVVDNVLYVHDDGVWTSAGSASAMDLSLEIVRRDLGVDVADGIARRMVVPPHRDGGQAQYVAPAPTPPTAEHALGQVMEWAVGNLEQDLSVAMLADRAAMSGRSFARHFRRATGATPHQWITAQRVARARSLLETSDLSVEQVATRSGLGSAANLRARLGEALGVTPTAYRRRFTRAS